MRLVKSGMYLLSIISLSTASRLFSAAQDSGVRLYFLSFDSKAAAILEEYLTTAS